MDPQAIAAVSLATATFVQILKAAGVSGKWALPVAALVSGLSIAIWAFSHGTFTRETSWDYFVAFGVVLSSAAGVFGLINKGAEGVTNMKSVRRMMRGER
jgi:hypothetical protein